MILTGDLMARLILMFKNRTLRDVHLGSGHLKIGRDSSNDIHLENPSVSRFHAEIYRQGFPFFVEDKKSTNGVYINDVRIKWKAELKEGDRITIGRHTMVFKHDPADDPENKGVNLSDIEGTIKI